MIIKHISQLFSPKRSRSVAAQLALFVMFVQVLAPLSVALAVPADQDQNTFYQVICSSYSAQDTNGSSIPSPLMGEDCTTCHVCTTQGLASNTPPVAFIALPLSLERSAPRETVRTTKLWTLRPAQARAPPFA